MDIIPQLPLQFHAGTHPIPFTNLVYSVFILILLVSPFYSITSLQTYKPLATRQTPPQNRQLISNDALSVSSTVGNF
ncbi:hypothetical protein J3F84DRAFT_358181 [Trichoderma pleuroticola]